MDEPRPASAEAPSDGAVPAPVGPPPPPPARHLRGITGVGVALVLAFVWGGLAYRELGPTTESSFAALASAGGGSPTAVLGTEAPPAWVGDFADAFCAGDADALAARIGAPLTGDVDAIEQALSSRDWSCAGARYIGGGANPKGSFYVYVMRDADGNEQWWVFTVVGEQVVAIE